MTEMIKAFVIDDDEISGSMICKMLSKLGVHAKFYSSSSESLDEIDKNDPELVFINFKAPKVNSDGFVIKHSERNHFLGRRVVLVTSSDDPKESQVIHQSLGIENVLQKPISFSDLEKIVLNHKEKRSSGLLNSKHIAVVDDDELGAKILIKNLEKGGLKCSYFSSGERFLAELRDSVPDLVLLDILMPGISGIGVLKNIREKYKSVELPVIMLTAIGEASDMVEALDSGANDYITKPANPDVALARVKTQVEMNNYYKDSLKKMELETLNAMIVTYNHEINTPLGVILLNMKEEFGQMTEENHEKSKEAINKIVNIIKSIRDIMNNGPNYSEYAGGQKMIDLKKNG